MICLPVCHVIKILDRFCHQSLAIVLKTEFPRQMGRCHSWSLLDHTWAYANEVMHAGKSSFGISQPCDSSTISSGRGRGPETEFHSQRFRQAWWDEKAWTETLPLPTWVSIPGWHQPVAFHTTMCWESPDVTRRRWENSYWRHSQTLPDLWLCFRLALLIRMLSNKTPIVSNAFFRLTWASMVHCQTWVAVTPSFADSGSKALMVWGLWNI